MAIFEFHWIAVCAIVFIGDIQAQRRDEDFNSFRGQNMQTGQRFQPQPQFNGQRWTPLNNVGTNRQFSNDGFQRPSSRTLGTDLNRPYNAQQGPPRTGNNVINRPYNARPISHIRNDNNGYNNRSPGNYGGFQRGPQFYPLNEQNNQLVNGQQRPLIPIANAQNSQPQGVANDYVQNRPYVINPPRPSFATDNLRNRPVYYTGHRSASRNGSNIPIYIRRAQDPPTNTDNVLSRPIYNTGGPIRVIDSESNKPINLDGFYSVPVTSVPQLSKQANLENSVSEQSKYIDNNKSEVSKGTGSNEELPEIGNKETLSTVSDQLNSVSEQNSSTALNDLKLTPISIKSDPSTANEPTLSSIEKSYTNITDKVSTLRKHKRINRLKTTTPTSTQGVSTIN